MTCNLKLKLNLVLATLGLVIGCIDDIGTRSPENVEVGLYAGNALTRTVMGQDGLSASWSEGDELALWAKDQSGSYVLSNQKFYTYGLDGQNGFFTSVLSSAMPEASYTYYCSYPAPISVSGSKVSFNVPSVQDGKVSQGADIMISNPVQNGALKPVSDLGEESPMKMNMNRMMHQFRFFIPGDNTVIGNDKLERILLTFPSGVTGNVTFDLENPAAPAELSASNASVELKLSTPLGISDSDIKYACLAFVPSQFAQGESLQVKAYTNDRIAYFDPIDLCGRTFEAGHSTPVKLNVRELVEYPYKITFKVTANNLGEGVNTIVLTAPQGCRWDNSGSNVFRYTPGHKITAGETFSLRFEDEAQYRAFSSKDISVTYDSDNTLTYQTVRISDLSASDNTSVNLSVPYLFYEDFSAIPGFSDGHDNPSTGLNSDTYKDIIELSSKTSVLSGWYATRIGAQAGTSVRLCCRYENVLWVGAFYKGRLYTPFLSNIKDGKDVNVSVSFRYGSAQKNAGSGKKATLYFGINYQDVVTNPDVLEGDSIIDSAAGLIGGSGFASSAPTSLSPMIINGEQLSTSGGSYTSFEGTKTVTVNGLDNSMRLAWIVSTNENKGNSNANFWLYLDDIKVKIVQ